VTSPSRLYWWLTEFFSIPSHGVGGADKSYNAMCRAYTRDLVATATQSQAIIDWLNGAMDLHCHVPGGPTTVGPTLLGMTGWRWTYLRGRCQTTVGTRILLETQYCERQTPFTPPVRVNGYVWLPQGFDPGPAFRHNDAHTNQTVRSCICWYR
jgi:hypothetical protein